MSRKRPVQSFSAYTGTEDLPEDFAAARPSRRRQGPAPDRTEKAVKGRGRLLRVLTLFLVSSLLFTAWHFRDTAMAWAGQYSTVEFELPEMNWPKIEAPVINRPIRSVRIATAVERITENEIRGMIAPHLGGGFFSIDVHALQQELQMHPWVERASVRRVWPDELTVEVHEQRPIALWGEAQLLNQHSELFQPDDFSGPSGLPQLDGPEGSAEEVMRYYQQFTRLLQPVGLRIHSLALSERGEWHLQTDSGIELEIGRDNVSGRVQRFARLYEQVLHEQASEIAGVDLRYSNGLAIRKGAPVR